VIGAERGEMIDPMLKVQRDENHLSEGLYKMVNPNFFIVGAVKAGTTLLYHYLSQHSNIYMCPIKEPHHFCTDIRCEDFSQDYRRQTCFDMEKYLNKSPLQMKHIAFIESRKQYLDLFREMKSERMAGEVSTGYLFSHNAAKEIHKFNPNAKIIMVLRESVERAFPHWVMDLRGTDVYRKSFLDAIEVD